MEVLSVKQINSIHDFLVDKGVHYEPLRLELLDHICCAIEQRMDHGWEFKKALSQSIHEFGPQGIERTQETTIYFLTLKLRKMKKLASILGIIGGLLTLVGTIFKLMHWPGAGIALLSGLGIVALFYLPLLLIIQLKSTSGAGKFTYIAGLFSAIVLVVGSAFKIMHWPGAGALMLAGMGLLGLLFMPLYFIRSYQQAENKLFKSSLVFVIFAGATMIFGLTRVHTSYFTSNGLYLTEDRILNAPIEKAEVNATISSQLLGTEVIGPKVQAVTSATNELCNYLDEVRYELIAATQGISKERAASVKVLAEIEWTKQNHRIDAIMLGDGDISAANLKTKIEAYNAFVRSSYTEQDRSLAQNIGLYIGEMKANFDQSDTWEKANFSEKPLFYVLMYLEHLKNDARSTEGQLLNYLMGQNTQLAQAM